MSNVMFYTFSHATPHLILFAGAIGGIVSKTAVYPLDLCKKRLQIQKFQQARTTYGEHFVCKGLFDCLAKTVAREGYRGKDKREIGQNVHYAHGMFLSFRLVQRTFAISH
jgi:hypothetical protein